MLDEGIQKMSFDIKVYCCVDEAYTRQTDREIEFDRNGIGLFLVEKGGCTVLSRDTSVTLGEGEIYCAGRSAVIKPDAASKVTVRFISGIIAERYAREISPAFVTGGLSSPFLPRQISRLAENFENYSDNYLANAAFEILNALSHDVKKAVIASQVIVDAINLIKENYAEVYGVEELAQALNISKSHLVREFYKHTGTTPGKYLNNIRIDAVKRLLVNTSLSLNSIAMQTGFSGDNYLCKAFKKATGETPMAYKNRIISSQYLPNQMVLSMETNII